jgi:ankyrin repeat protein
MTFKGEQASERQMSLRKIMTWVLLGLGVLSFFLPLVSFNAPIVGNVYWSALNVVSGMFRAQNVERPSFQGIVGSKEDSDSTESHPIPLSIRQAVLFPIAMILAYLVLCFLLAAEFFSLSTTSRKQVGILGTICSLFGLLSIFVLSNGFRQEMSSSFDGAGSGSSPFSGIGQALVQSVRIEPGGGLYLLATVMVLLFLVNKMSVLDSLELRTSLNSNSAENSTPSVSAPQSIAKQRHGASPTKTIVGAGSILVAILALIIYSSNSSRPSPTRAREQLAQMGIHYDAEDFLAAAYKGDTKAVSLLLDAGMSPNEKLDDEGNTALIVAVVGEKASISRMLVERGADVNVKSHEGWTPLLYAARNNDIQTTKLLLDRGADVNAVGPKDITPLMSAVMKHQIDEVKILLDRGADPNRKDNDGFTTLMFAAGVDDANIAVGMVRVILAKGADVNAQSNNGRTALSIAVQAGHPEVVDELKRAGAKASN